MCENCGRQPWCCAACTRASGRVLSHLSVFFPLACWKFFFSPALSAGRLFPVGPTPLVLAQPILRQRAPHNPFRVRCPTLCAVLLPIAPAPLAPKVLLTRANPCFTLQHCRRQASLWSTALRFWERGGQCTQRIEGATLCARLSSPPPPNMCVGYAPTQTHDRQHNTVCAPHAGQHCQWEWTCNSKAHPLP